MKQINDKDYRIDVDKAWDVLYERLKKDQLLTDETACSSHGTRRIPLKWVAVAAVVCIGFFLSIFYFPYKPDQSLVFMQNKENTGALVITLDDGSIVYLASNASITYPPAFNTGQRKVKLNGNALFYVTKDEKRPFVIETNEKITIEVVGTIFAVNSSPDNSFELSVKQGKVNVHSMINQTNVPVEAGETVQLDSDGLRKSRTENIWIFSRFTDKMCFKDEKLNTIIHAINTLYGTPSIVNEESLNNRKLTVTFEGDSVETIAELICQALNLKRINKQDTIYIRP